MSVEQKKYWQSGRDYELNRILKILQPFAEHGELCESGCYPEDCDAVSFQYAIELIKGEQKSEWPDEGEDWNIEPYDHPPQRFRDRSNGE